MYSNSPVNLTINLDKLKYNIQHTFDLCKANFLDLAFVTKSFCADPEIMKVVEESPITTIADSRIQNFANMHTSKCKLLIRPSVPGEADDVIRFSDMSVQSSMESVQALGNAAAKQNQTHAILIMVDPGDLRDGIYVDNKEDILHMATFIHNHPHLSLNGIAANYNCFLGLQPLPDNMKKLSDVFELLRPYYDVDTPILSGGNSSSVKLLTQHTYEIPSNFTQFRMGEAIVLGRDPADNTFIEDYMTDVFTLSVPLLEVSTKPVQTESGIKRMRRGVLALGQQDLQTNHLIPKDTSIQILGSCSDETVLNLDSREDLKAGDCLDFNLEYGALMTLFAGQYYNKTYV